MIKKSSKLDVEIFKDSNENLKSEIIIKNEMLAVKETVKIEVGEVKLEAEDVDSESFEVDQITWNQAVKDDNFGNTDQIDRIKNESVVFEMQAEIIKLEQDLESEKFGVPDTSEEFVIIKENVWDLDSGKIEERPDFVASISSKIHQCTLCTYKTTNMDHLARHMWKHPEAAGSSDKLSKCIHCSRMFRLSTLDDHIIKKHPDFIASVSSKIHQCTFCTYKTTMRYYLERHMWKHPDAAGGSYKLSKCIHCSRMFRNKSALDDHVIKNHPDFIASVSSKIHQCTLCTFKTTVRNHLARHMLKHPETAGSYKLSICIHCNKTFKSKQKLDGHIIVKHPEFIKSVSSKIHECAHCTYKTNEKNELTKHMTSKHAQRSDGYKSRKCVHCDATFKIKRSLDEHIVNKHPETIATVSVKIYECTLCTYKTTIKNSFARHKLKHPETKDSYEFSICIHCSATFTKKKSLDNHTIREHPEFIASVSSKIHECPYCTYKTTVKGGLARHLLKHPQASSSCKLSRCTHCDATFKSKPNLKDHIVKNHPEFIAAVPSKIHECTQCPYKTTLKHSLDMHKLKHLETVSICEYCDVSFKSRQGLYDHIIKKHPDSAASVPSKIYECKHCTYKTTRKSTLARHMLKHSETETDFKISTCVNCNATFKSKKSLDDHIVREHPDFVESVSNKIHECSHCTYKTTQKNNLTRHMMKHPEATG